MPAWEAYSSAVRKHAEDKATRMKEFHAERHKGDADVDTATRMDHMSQWMREKADRLEMMAKDTRAFQQVLNTDQQTIFDMYWKSHFGRGKGRGHHRR
jgi:hypothetical protein